MAGARFQVKLYGHTGDDVESFCTRLAAILVMSETETMILMHEVPVVVRDNLSKSAAENLNELLTSIRGLSIVEPMDGMTAEPVAPVAEPVVQPLPRPGRVPDKRDEARSKLWLALGVGTAACLAIFIVVGMIVTYTNLYKTLSANRGPSTEEANATSVSAPRGSIGDLEVRVESLRDEYSALRAERDAAFKDLSVADQRLSIPGEMKIRNKRLADAKAKMKKVLEELVATRKELSRMKKGRPPKTSE